MRIVKTFENKSSLIFDRGKFDDWCVYFVTSKGRRMALKDIDYFGKLKKYAEIYSITKLYEDFVKIYDKTNINIEPEVLDYITTIASTYKEKHSLDVIFTVLYMTMVAEEQKENTRLGKRIKRLGVYNLLVNNRTAEESAEFMKNMTWVQIDKLCKDRGF